MRLVLIRHGHSEHLRRKIIAGVSGCPGLTPDGRAQAETLAERFCATGELDDCRVLLTSPVPRARQTAEILSRALPVSAVEEDSNLSELRPGDADGLPEQVYESRYGVFDLFSFPDRPFAPGGESWSIFMARVQDSLEQLARKYAGKTVVAVTHSGYVVASILSLFAIPRPGTGAQLNLAHTSITEWRKNDVWALERYNDASHLGTVASG